MWPFDREEKKLRRNTLRNNLDVLQMVSRRSDEERLAYWGWYERMARKGLTAELQEKRKGLPPPIWWIFPPPWPLSSRAEHAERQRVVPPPETGRGR